jgi:hypothetical protein
VEGERDEDVGVGEKKKRNGKSEQKISSIDVDDR